MHHFTEGRRKYLSYFVFIYQNPISITKQYLTALCKLKGVETAKIVFNYIIVVKAKYLQLVSVFYTYRNDLIRVEDEFKCFNSDFEQLEQLHLKLFNEKFNPENCPDVPSDMPLTMVPMETIILEQKSVDVESNDKEDDFKKSKNEANGEELHMIPLNEEGNNFVPSKKSDNFKHFKKVSKFGQIFYIIKIYLIGQYF